MRSLLSFDSRAFQSTPPVKAATAICENGLISSIISIHAAREGGDLVSILCFVISEISIHAAREGGDSDRSAQSRV